MDELGVRTHFLRVLGLSPGATREEILIAWARRLKECGSDTETDEVNQAYCMLMDPILLRKYMIEMSRLHKTLEGNNGPEQEKEPLLEPYREDSIEDATFDALAELYHVAMSAGALAAQDNRACDPPKSAADFHDAVYSGAVGAAKRMAEIIIQQIKQANKGCIDQKLVRDLFNEATKLGAQAAEEHLKAYEKELREKPGEPFLVKLKRLWAALGGEQPEYKPYARRQVRPDYLYIIVETQDAQEKQ